MRFIHACQPIFVCLTSRLWLLAAVIVVLAVGSTQVAGDCPEEPQLQNYTGTGTTVCPCFVEGEQAGAILNAPPEHYPIEVLRVGIGWGSMYGGTPQSLEQAIHIYDAGLPDPGTPIASLEGPVMTDGYINEFDLEPLPGEIIVDSGAFTVTLEFLNSNAGDPGAPSMVHDGNGCQSGKNVVFAIPGGWFDACALGVTGDWIVYAIYRQVDCGAGVDHELVTSNCPAVLIGPQPNPSSHETQLDFILRDHEHVVLSIYDVTGQVMTTLVDGMFTPGRHSVVWSGQGANGTPVAPGIYFAVMQAGAFRSTKKLTQIR